MNLIQVFITIFLQLKQIEFDFQNGLDMAISIWHFNSFHVSNSIYWDHISTQKFDGIS